MRERYEQALAIYRAIGNRLGEANCVRSLGDVHYMLNEYDPARERYEQALPIYQAIGNRLGEANCASSLGDVHSGIGNYPTAVEDYQKSIILYDAIENRAAAAGACGQLAQVFARIKATDKAKACCKEVIERYRALDDAGQLAWGYNAVGSVYDTLKRYPEAVSAFREAARHSPENALLYRNLADSAIKSGQVAVAGRALETAERLQPGHPYLPVRRAQRSLAQGDAAEALAQTEMGLSRPGAPAASLHWVRAQAFLLLERQPEARAALEACIAATSDPHDFADYLEEAGQFKQNHPGITGMDELIASLKFEQG